MDIQNSQCENEIVKILQFSASLFEAREQEIYHAFLAKKLGAIPTLILTHACRWQGAFSADVWWESTAMNWENELGLTTAEQKNALSVLINRKLLDTEKIGKPAKLHLRVNVAQLVNYLMMHRQNASIKKQEGATKKIEEKANDPEELSQKQPVSPVEATAGEDKKESIEQKFRCLTVPVENDMHPSTAQIFSKNPPAFFSEAILEHPGIPGLMLTHDQRLVRLKLEYVDDDGVAAFETAGQSYNRLAWKKPAAPSPSRTEKDFVKITSVRLKRE